VSNPFEKVGQLIDSAKEAEIVTPDFSVSAKGKRQRKRAPDRARPDGAAEAAWHARVRRRRQSSRLSGFKNVVDRQVDELGGDHHCQQHRKTHFRACGDVASRPLLCRPYWTEPPLKSILLK
jgi:hypothetical protein